MDRSAPGAAIGGPVVVGLGEPSRRDDGSGPAVVRALATRVPPGVRLVERVGDATQLLELWDGATVAIAVDAVVSGAPPGTLVRLEGPELRRLAAARTTSSHGLSLRDALELSAALGRLPQRLVAYLVEAAETGPGVDLSPAVARAVEQAAERIAHELMAPAPHPTEGC